MKIKFRGKGATVLAASAVLLLSTSLAAHADSAPSPKIDSFYTFANGSTGAVTSASVTIETGLDDQHPAATSTVIVSGVPSITPIMNAQSDGWTCSEVDLAAPLTWACSSNSSALQNGPYGFMLGLPSEHGSVKVDVTTGFNPEPAPGAVPEIAGGTVAQSYTY